MGTRGHTSVAPHTGMLAVMMAHVDQLGGLLDSAESRFHHFFRLSDKGDHCTVGRCTRIHVKEPYPFNALGCIGNLLDNLHITSLAEIGDAFNKFSCHVNLILVFCNQYCLPFNIMVSISCEVKL